MLLAEGPLVFEPKPQDGTAKLQNVAAPRQGRVSSESGGLRGSGPPQSNRKAALPAAGCGDCAKRVAPSLFSPPLRCEGVPLPRPRRDQPGLPAPEPPSGSKRVGFAAGGSEVIAELILEGAAIPWPARPLTAVGCHR